MKIGLACVLFSFVALSVGSALSESLTYDEVFYLEEGQRIWNMREFADPYNPPLAPFMTAVPVAFGWTEPVAGRLVTVAFGVILILAVYRVGGLVAALLLSFEPTILANSHYVTGDIAVTLFVFLATMAWMRFLKRAGGWRALLLGLAVGYALASKMTAIPYLVVSFAACWWWQRSRRGWHWMMRHRLRVFGGVAVALLVIWASYLFTWDVVIREREDPHRASTRFVAYAREKNMPQLERFVIFLGKQPLPLGTYLAIIKNNVFRIGKPAKVFFDGTLYDQSQWYFMVVNVLRKLPLLFLILIIIGARNSVRFVAIGVGIVVITSMLGMVPLVRYVLPAVPFLAIVGAAGIREIGEIRGIWGKTIISIFLLWYIGGALAQYPHFISYANELVGPRDKRYEVLADSNLDWGQALPDLARYVQTQKIGKVKLSYFGRDDENEWRFEEICAFHDEVFDPKLKRTATVISVSNWYYCGYNTKEDYKKEKIQEVVSDVFLIF